MIKHNILSLVRISLPDAPWFGLVLNVVVWLFLPQPPHVGILVGEEAVGVVTAVLAVVEAATVNCV